MKVQPDTDNHIQRNDAMVEQVEAIADQCLELFKKHLTRSQAHPSDATGGEHASADKHRASTAAPRNQQPASASHGAKNAENVQCRLSASGLLRPKDVRAKHPPLTRAHTGVAVLLATGLILVAGRASATDFAEQAINTDRPGITYSTSIVPAGHLQVETGLPTFEDDPLPDGHSLLLSAPTYLRYGISDDFEVQLAAPPWNRLTTTQGGHRHSVSGAGDLQLGGKFALSAGGGAMPALTLIGYVTAPTGNRNFSAGRPAYNFNAIASWSLTGSTSFTTMASFTRAPADGDRHANSGTLAVSLSHNFTSQLTAYAETGRFPGYTHTSSTALAGGGMTYLLSPHVQVDGFFDVGLNHASPTSVFGTGVSILL